MPEPVYFRFPIVKHLFLFCLCFVVISGCQQKPDESEFDANKYMAHLQLQTSTVVVTELLGDLEVPWEITYGSDGWLWFTEQKGTITRIHPESGEKKVLHQIPDVHYVKSRGLLGMAVHPDLENNPYVFCIIRFHLKEVIN